METIRQDLPPPGGFSRVQYERVPLKQFLSGPKKWLIFIGVSALGWVGYYMDKNRLNYLSVEKKAAEFSFYPLLMAENDRLRLKVFRRLRDEEAELMKNVEGWEVGKYKGRPIYKSLPPDTWYEADMVFALKPFISKQDHDFASKLQFSH